MRDMLYRSSRRTFFPSRISLYHDRPRIARTSPVLRIRFVCAPTGCIESTVELEGPFYTAGLYIVGRLLLALFELLVVTYSRSGILLLKIPAFSLRLACVPALFDRVASGFGLFESPG
jgi:hypothetical protein